MNEIILDGIIRSIQPSHVVAGVEYDKADMIVKRLDGKEDIINIRFKKFSNPYKNDQHVILSGNVRSYSKQDDNGKNKVNIYVFTYFDYPPSCYENSNIFHIDGRICKMDDMRTTSNGKQNIHFILANNLICGNQKLNSYLPCIAWGSVAEKMSKLSISDKIDVFGELHSREYKKVVNGEVEIRVAHELVITSFVKVE